MADSFDASIIIGSQPDEASARKTGEALGRAAGAAANSAFLASFNAIFDKIPVSDKAVKGSISMPAKAREALDTLISIASDDTQSGVTRRAAMKSLIGATREYSRKTPQSISSQVAADAAIALGQEAINISAQNDRARRNAAINGAKKIDILSEAYALAASEFYATGARLDSAVAGGDPTEIAFAKQKHLSAAKYLQSRRFKNVANAEDIKKAQDVEKEHIRALQKNTQAMIYLNTAVAAVGAGAQIATSIATSFMQQHVDRNVFGSVAAYNSRVTAAGTVGGGVAGTLLGAVLGGFLGPGGAIVGAQLGGTVGGALGGLPGTALAKAFEGKKRTIQDFQTRIRANNMYRGAYSPSFGGMVQEMGMATAGDVENMVGNSQTLAARMMFGQVGENEMLMYSLMPNYFAAAMAGASDAELAAAYAQDLNALPPMFRLWAGSSVGGGSAGMAAFAQDPFYNKVLGNAGKGHWLDQMMVAYSGGWQGGSIQRGLDNAELALSEGLNVTAVTPNEHGIFDANSGLRPVFAHTNPRSGARPIANSFDLKEAYKNGTMLQSTYEDIFQNSGYMFNEVSKLINKRDAKEYAKAQGMLYGDWGEHESVIVNLYVDGNKQEEVRIRGEQAARAGQMSVYFGG